MVFHLMFVHIIFGSVRVAEWPPFGNKLLIRVTICFLCIMIICNFSCFPYWLLGQDLESDCFSSCLCLRFYFYQSSEKCLVTHLSLCCVILFY